MDELLAIETWFGMRLPPQYRDWVRRGYIDLESPEYLWIYEAEWVQPRDIPSYELSFCETIQGLVPFAFNGAGDLWCWNTAQPTATDQYTILFCPHDEPDANVYAPSFAGWFFRMLLEYATSVEDDPEEIAGARTNLRTWAGHLGRLGYTTWATEIMDLADREPRRTRPQNLRVDLFGFLPWDEADARVTAEFGEGYVKNEIRWHMLG